MWKAKLEIRHNCIFDQRCEEFGVEVTGISFNPFKKGDLYFIYHFGTVFGNRANDFFTDIKKDKRVHNLERDGNTFFIIERRKTKTTPGSWYSPELIYIKPVVIDTKGTEHWELASLQKETITAFSKKMKRCKVVSIQKTELKDIYFPRLSPNLTEKQRNALDLAMKKGYYTLPQRIDLNGLAKLSKVSRATFREHLRKAERKILGGFSS